ncbi:Coenzyme F420 hydrogenase/dehydrogenase, beta subunit C-terminal domain [Selenomonas sp. AB3002]|uniref:Coenzyme F420 hydrogenase/dehydrogenase, beta subunit C-terminal domain n=1 Tax=Selenomonas sp. AB3002 TaxID=1392502 RepID=UPI00068DB168
MKYDVGILGRYNNSNWGGSLTVLVTYSTISDMGFKAKLLKVKGHDDDKNVIYNRLCDFTKVLINNPMPPKDWNRYFSNFLLCSDWTLYKNWFLPLDMRMFSWVEKNNIISMAASFGTETGNYDKSDYPMLYSYLKRFRHLSIREKFGLDLCKKIGIDHAVIMPDPIFSQGKEYYYKIAQAYSHKSIEGKYAAVYLLDMSDNSIELAINTAKQMNLKPVFIVAQKDKDRIEKNRERLERYIYVNNFSESLSAWIYYLYHSEAIITNSFHGACLGYIFEKNVFGIERGRLSSRLVDLLQQFGIKNRFISKLDDIDKAIKEPVDSNAVKDKIMLMNNKVREFLVKAITDGKKQENRIDYLPRVECTGCMSCVNVCPKKCISIEKDKETGFLYPKIDESICVNCGICGKACPVLSKNELTGQINTVWCGFSKDKEIRYLSTSGGFFSELAKGVFAKGNAVVFGAAYETPQKVVHTEIFDEKDIPRIRQSKYVQSEVRDTYLKMERHLRDGKNVMFCGTPCQCAAVRSFINAKKIPDDNLYLVDFICHSVNSPKAYQAYLAEIENNIGDSIKKVWFKNKEISWEKFSTRIDFETKEPYYIKNRYEDSFYKGFLKHHLYSRPSCSHCNFKGEKRHSDITLADAWGIAMNCDKSHGISTAIIHTDKGVKLFDEIKEKLYVEEKNIEAVSKGNVNFMSSTQLGRNSKYFYQRLAQGIPFSKIIDEIDTNKLVKEQDVNKLDESSVKLNGAVVRAHSTAKIITNSNSSLILNAGKLPGSNSDCLIEMDEGSKIIVEGNFKIYHSCRIKVHKNAVLTLGNGYMNTNSIVVCAKSINIGDAIIAPNCYIVDSDYHKILEDGKVINPPAPVKFEGHVWLGQNVTILKGVTIGRGCCIGAKSLVTKDIPADSLAVGVPAKVVRSNIEWR